MTRGSTIALDLPTLGFNLSVVNRYVGMIGPIGEISGRNILVLGHLQCEQV
jgi:hypothetical protein